jgi:hypothetical protein
VRLVSDTPFEIPAPEEGQPTLSSTPPRATPADCSVPSPRRYLILMPRVSLLVSRPLTEARGRQAVGEDGGTAGAAGLAAEHLLAVLGDASVNYSAQTRSPRESSACALRARSAAADEPYRRSIEEERQPYRDIRSPSEPPAASH